MTDDYLLINSTGNIVGTYGSYDLALQAKQRRATLGAYAHITKYWLVVKADNYIEDIADLEELL